MKKKIAVLKGDGIGPEIVNESLKVLKKIGEKYNHEFETTELYFGGASIDKYGQITWHDGTGVVRQYNLEQGKIWTIPYTEADYRNYAGVKTNKSKGNEGGKDTPGKRGKTWQEYYEALKHRNNKKSPPKGGSKKRGRSLNYESDDRR